jgi:hypothetical protein
LVFIQAHSSGVASRTRPHWTASHFKNFSGFSTVGAQVFGQKLIAGFVTGYGVNTPAHSRFVVAGFLRLGFESRSEKNRRGRRAAVSPVAERSVRRRKRVSAQIMFSGCPPGRGRRSAPSPPKITFSDRL